PKRARLPGTPSSDAAGTVPPHGMMAPGNANNLAGPNWMNVKAAKIRSTLRSGGARVGQLRTRFDAVMVLPPVGGDTLQQPSVSQPPRTCRERVRGAPPPELVHVPAHGRVGPRR